MARPFIANRYAKELPGRLLNPPAAQIPARGMRRTVARFILLSLSGRHESLREFFLFLIENGKAIKFTVIFGCKTCH
jgi:hypothetical protein